MLIPDWLIQKLSQKNVLESINTCRPGLKSFNKDRVMFSDTSRHSLSRMTMRGRGVGGSGVWILSKSHGYGLRSNDSGKLPEFEILLKWLKWSCSTPVPVKTFKQVLEDPRELVVIQERLATLSSEDETLRKLHSLDGLRDLEGRCAVVKQC